MHLWLHERIALGDGSSRANRPTSRAIKANEAFPGIERVIDGKEIAKIMGIDWSKIHSRAAAAAPSKKRKNADSSSLPSRWDEECAKYTQDLDDRFDPDALHEAGGFPSCGVTRGRLRRLFERKIMTRKEFCEEVGCSTGNLSRFMNQKGSMGGHAGAIWGWACVWFRQREMAGLTMPTVQKKRKIEEGEKEETKGERKEEKKEEQKKGQDEEEEEKEKGENEESGGEDAPKASRPARNRRGSRRR